MKTKKDYRVVGLKGRFIVQYYGNKKWNNERDYNLIEGEDYIIETCIKNEESGPWWNRKATKVESKRTIYKDHIKEHWVFHTPFKEIGDFDTFEEACKWIDDNVPVVYDCATGKEAECNCENK